MSPRRFDDRVRDLVRVGDAEANPSRRSQPDTTPFDAPLMDMVARTLAIPMPRRRAIGLMAGALLAGSAWRPGRARAVTCGGAFPKKCKHSGGAEVCTTADGSCCETKNCIVGCTGCQTCSGGTCSDTPTMCGHPDCGFTDATVRPKFCSVTGTVTYFCTDSKPVPQTAGWCCRAGETCNTGKFGECTCTGEICKGDALCCQKGTLCVDSFFSSPYCTPGCGPRHDRQPCGGRCCTDSQICTITGCGCPSGKVAYGEDCGDPKKDPGGPKPKDDQNLLDTIMQTAASHGGPRNLRSMFARPAQSGSPAVDAALVALAAVNGQGAAAQLAFLEGKRDPAFRRKVRVTRVKPPTVVAGPGLNAASAASLNKLLAAEAKAYALVAASAKALWRARAAQVKGQRAFARSQMRASAKLAGQAASALKRLPTLRTAAANALTAGGTVEVFPSEAQVIAFLATVKSGGIPTYLRTPLGALGVGNADLKRLRANLARVTAAGSQAALIAPLKDANRDKSRKLLISELSKFSTRARKHPVAR
jgi:hypothetical protein